MPQKRTPQTIAANQVLARLVQWAASAPEGAGEHGEHNLIRLLRVRLGMTQAQLAKRCGLPQSHIAKIEKGKGDIQLDTLRHIFAAMVCRLVVAPQPETDLDGIVRKQARNAALKRVRRLAGTMAMEEQRPEEDMLEALVRAETEKLLEKRSSEIWEVE